MDKPIKDMTDWELLQWAIANAGWKFHYSNDQIEAPGGSLTTFVNRSDMGDYRRKQIIEMMTKRGVAK